LTLSSAVRVAAYRARQREAGVSDSTRRNRPLDRAQAKKMSSFKQRPFVGCDGEGCGVDDKGRQLFMLFRMGDRELFTGNPLTTYELLDFICDHPSGDLLVGFAFGYDVTMILRDLSEKQQRKLFEPKTFEQGHSPYVWYKTFDIDYLPKQYLRVKRVQIVRNVDGTEKRVSIKGSQRTIYETFGFFQKSFVKCIEQFEVGTNEQRQIIAANKAQRGSFEGMDENVRAYCALECQFLGELMQKLREYCHAAGIVPRTWNGAGKLAAALHRLHKTPRREEANQFVPVEVQNLANMAYYGGRFEITRVGEIKDPIYEYDIRSAYPDAMRRLPCLCHGRWERVGAKELRNFRGLYIAVCRFKHAVNQQGGISQLGGLPVRSREGHLFWPRQGGGIYWSPEIISAELLGAKISFRDGFVYHRECDCPSFEWVKQLYDYRRSIGSAGHGYPIKLGINSLYGKLAQRKGNGIYNNMIWAGLITAHTRTRLNEAISHAPGRIAMLATDGVYSLDKLPSLEVGDELGQWECNKLDGLFIVQPGLYWCPEKRKRKSRGLPGKFFEEEGRTESFEQAWNYYHAEENAGIGKGFPEVSVPIPGFVGLKLALARNKPEMAGTWIKDQRAISFDYRNKRQSHIWQDNHIVTSIKPGSSSLLSLPHGDFLKAGGQEPWELARNVLEEQPDWIDLGPPFEES
jgi:hypothetical protein